MKAKQPKAAEAWGVYMRSGTLFLALPDRAVAETYCVGGWKVHPVRIVPITKKRKPRRKA